MMNTGEIKIIDGKVVIHPVDGTVWLTASEIARLFSVYVVKVTSNIRSILRDHTLWESEVTKIIKTSSSQITFYNLDMITALAYRIKTLEAKAYRQWVTERLTKTLLVWKIPGGNSMYN